MVLQVAKPRNFKIGDSDKNHVIPKIYGFQIPWLASIGQPLPSLNFSPFSFSAGMLDICGSAKLETQCGLHVCHSVNVVNH